MAIKINESVANRIVNDTITILSFGSNVKLNIYDGIQPVYPETGNATSGNLLVQFSGLAWTGGNSGTLGSRALTSRLLGTAGTSGTAIWARMTGASGAYVIDGICGTSGTCDFIINTTNIISGQVIILRAATLIRPT